MEIISLSGLKVVRGWSNVCMSGEVVPGSE